MSHTSRRWVGQVEAGFTVEGLQDLATDLIVAEAAPANFGEITQNEIDAVAGNGDIDVRSQSSEINMKPPRHALLASSGLFDKFAGNPLGHIFDDFAGFFPIAFISDGDMDFVPNKRVSGRVVEEMVLENKAIGEEHHPPGRLLGADPVANLEHGRAQQADINDVSLDIIDLNPITHGDPRLAYN